MHMSSCDRHKGMVIVFQAHQCPMCIMLKSLDSAGKLTEEAMNMIDIEDSAEELSEVAQMLLKGMEKLRGL
jgi:hypothetical protein